MSDIAPAPAGAHLPLLFRPSLHTSGASRHQTCKLLARTESNNPSRKEQTTELKWTWDDADMAAIKRMDGDGPPLSLAKKTQTPSLATAF